jgi:hypothetical protein
VTGKGGVGKTAVARALGHVAARRGHRTMVAEVAGRGGENGQVAENLFTLSVDPEHAMEEYLSDQLPAALAEVLTSSRMFGYFAAATPGMRELLTVGKLWELAQPERRTPGADPYDLVVVDAPATGHGLAMLDAARTFAHVAVGGPVARHARIIHGTLTDRDVTGIVAVSTPEEMPVNEIDYLRHELGDRLDLVIANAVRPDRFSDGDAKRLARAADARSGGRPGGGAAGAGAAAARAALAVHARARDQREKIDRLGPHIELPFAPDETGGVDVDALTAALDEAL